MIMVLFQKIGFERFSTCYLGCKPISHHYLPPESLLRVVQMGIRNRIQFLNAHFRKVLRTRLPVRGIKRSSVSPTVVF